MIICRKCGIEKELDSFGKNKARKNGIQNACKACKYEERKVWINEKGGREIVKDYWKTYKSATFNRYKCKASKRNIEFKLSKQDFDLFWKAPCFYCNAPIERAGIDRLNNDIGYVLNNCVSCCWDCNTKKNAITLDIAAKMLHEATKRGLYKLDSDHGIASVSVDQDSVIAVGQ